MRLVHEISAPMQGGGGVKPYCNTRGKCGFNGARVELFYFTSPAANHPDLPPGMFSGEQEALYIEGDAKYLKEMLESMLEIVNDTLSISEKELGPQRATNCPHCTPDDHQPNATHTEACMLSMR